VLAPGGLAVLAGCTVFFPFAAPSGGDGGASAKDAGRDSGRDSGSADAGHDAEQPPADAAIDAAPCGVLDADGDGYRCDVDCDDGDPLHHPDAPWPTFFYDDDSAGSSDNHFDFVIEADGRPAIAYADAANDDLFIARKGEDGWRSRLAADAHESARQVDLAAGPDGVVVCFWDEGNDGGPLRVWSATDNSVVDLTGDLSAPGPTCAVGVDAANDTHLAYYDPSTGLVMHQSGAGGNWAFPDVVGAARSSDFGGYWSRIALVVGAEDSPWIVYRTDDPDALVLARWTGDAWVLDPAAFEGRFPAIDFAEGSLELCFKETDADRMAHGSWDAVLGWAEPEVFGAVRTNDLWCSLARYGGIPYVAWEEEPVADGYSGLVSRRLDDESWDLESLIPAGSEESPRRPRLAVDPDGHLHVVYLDNATATLKHGVLHEDCP